MLLLKRITTIKIEVIVIIKRRKKEDHYIFIYIIMFCLICICFFYFVSKLHGSTELYSWRMYLTMESQKLTKDGSNY